MFSATSCEVLKYFDSLDQIVNTEIDELTDFITKARKNRFKNPSENADKLAKAERISYRFDSMSYDSITILLHSPYLSSSVLKRKSKIFL